MNKTAPSASPTPRRNVQSQQPATGQVWRSFEPASTTTVLAAVDVARAGQPAWAATPVGLRVHFLRRFHELLYDRRWEVAELICRETDKPAAEAMLTEVGVALDDTTYLARTVPSLFRTGWFTTPGPAYTRKRLRVIHEPYGVVGVITPWNYPFMLACARLLPALATGNAVVFKPSELTPSTGALLHELVIAAGVPAGVVQLVQGDGVTGAALAESAVDKMFFTGSVRAGRSVAHACAERLVPCELELGGSDAAIVLADANVPVAAAGIAWGRFSNAGQTCVAPKRVFVEEPVYDAFVAAVGRVVTELRTGSGADPATDVGAMIRPEFRVALEAQRDDAIARGGHVAARSTDGGPNVFPPTILVDVPDDARVMQEETFGPLMTVIRVRDADDAVARANSGDFGLSASVWSRDSVKASALAGRLECGTVALNDVLVTAGTPALPHGGVKRSGIGRTHGAAGLEACVRTKGVVADRFPSWRQPQWFGYSAARRDEVDAFLRFGHGHGLFDRIRALPGVFRFLLRPDRPLER